jgi:hypothetical protein
MRHFFRQKLAKIAENFDHYIDLRFREFIKAIVQSFNKNRFKIYGAFLCQYFFLLLSFHERT